MTDRRVFVRIEPREQHCRERRREDAYEVENEDELTWAKRRRRRRLTYASFGAWRSHGFRHMRQGSLDPF